MVDDEDIYTFRKWNQEKKYVPYGQNVDAVDEISTANPFLCYLYLSVNRCFNFIVSPVIDLASDEKIESEEYFRMEEDKSKASGQYMRAFGVILTVFGVTMIAYPIAEIITVVAVFKWILSTSLFVASFIFSLLVGVTLSFLIIATAWFTHKPLFSITMLTVAAISIYLLLFFEWDNNFGAGYREGI